MLKDDIEFYLQNRVLFDGVKEATASACRTDLNKLESFAFKEKIERSDQITPEFLKKMMDSMAGEGASEHTLRRMISTLHGFFRSLMLDGQIREDPSEILSGPEDASASRRQGDAPLSREEMDRLMQTPPRDGGQGIRDALILGLLCGTGIRTGELLRLRLSDIDPVICYITVMPGTDEERRIPFPGSLYPVLEKYLRAKGSDFSVRNDILFRNRSGEPLSRQGLWKIVHRYGRMAGIEGNVTPDRIRSSVLVSLSQSGADEEHICRLMGYQSAAAMRAALRKSLAQSSSEDQEKTAK